MNPSDAEAIALQHMANQIKLQYCPSERVPTTFYNFNADQYHVFVIEDPRNLGIGGDRYIAVNKVDGSIRDLGFTGE